MYGHKKPKRRSNEFVPRDITEDEDYDILPSKVYKHPDNPLSRPPLPPIRRTIMPPSEEPLPMMMQQQPPLPKPRYRTRSQGPITPPMNLPGSLRSDRNLSHEMFYR